jgi:hypothetical protein
LLLGVESFSRQLGRSYVDLAFAFYAATALAWAITFRATGDRRAALMAGVTAGLAMGVKYFGLWVVVAILVGLATAGSRRLAGIAVAAVGAALAAAPWLLKNAVLSGNPFFPFLFAGTGWDESRALWFSQWGTGWLATDPFQIALAPVSIVLTGSEGAAPWDFTVGPLLLILSIPALAGLPNRSAAAWVRGSLQYGAVLLLAWVAGAAASRLLAIVRLLMPLLLPWSVIAALGWESSARLSIPRLSLQRFLAGLTALMLGLAGAGLAFDTVRSRTAEVVLGALPEETYLYERLGWHYAAMESVNRLAPTSVVQYLFEPRSYYSTALRSRPDGILDEWFHVRRTFATQADILAGWRRQGITHVLVYYAGADFLRRQGADPLSAEDWAAFDVLLDNDLVLVEALGPAYGLYNLPNE